VILKDALWECWLSDAYGYTAGFVSGPSIGKKIVVFGSLSDFSKAGFNIGSGCW